MKKITLVVGLVLGLAAMWTATAPSIAGADTLIGGWEPIEDGSCCDYTGSADCNEGQPSCNPWGTTPICVDNGDGSCDDTGGPDQCSGGVCDTTHPSECN